MRIQKQHVLPLFIFCGLLALPPREATAAATQLVESFRDHITVVSDTGVPIKVWVEADIVDRKKPSWLIMNGATNSATRSFVAFTWNALEHGENVVRFDFLDQANTLRGNPPLGSSTTPTTVATQAELVTKLLPAIEQRLGLSGGFDVTGQSYGGGVAYYVAMYHPNFAEHYFCPISCFGAG